MTKILEVKNVAKSYESKVIHKNVTFSLNQGETLGLLGHSGTGKSVLLRSIIGLEEIDSGEIYYRGSRIDNLSEKQLYEVRKKISYSFQNGALFDSVNVFENIAYPLFEHTRLKEREISVKVKEILALVNMEDAISKMPSELSGGMQKRVGLARSMALDPDILLYDEPTAGLDPMNVDMVIEVIRRFKNEGFAGILVTHDIPVAKKVCDRLIILKDGVIHFSGSIDEFEESNDSFVKSFHIVEE